MINVTKSFCLLFMVFFITVASALSDDSFSGGISCNDLQGFIEPSETIEISSLVPGIIDQIMVDRGDIVRKGQPLAKLKSDIESVAVDLAKARVEFGKRKDQRNIDLFQKKLISRHEKDELETELEISRLQLQEAEESLKQKTILSPVSGVVVKRELAKGEYIGEGSVMTIAQINPLYVEVIVPVECYGKIKKGNKATVILDAPVTGKYLCSVKVVDSVIDSASGTFGVRLMLPNPKGNLPAGLKSRVRFH